MSGTSTRAAVVDRVLDDFATVIGQAMDWPRMAGRTAGVLLLSERPMTVQQLRDELGASTGSVSEMTRLLIDNGVVHRFKRPGTRQYVYEWRADAWVGCLEHQLRETSRLRDLARGAKRRSAPLTAKQRRRLREMATFYDFMVAHLTTQLAEYRDLAGA